MRKPLRITFDRFAVSLRGMVGASEAYNLDLAGC